MAPVSWNWVEDNSRTSWIYEGNRPVLDPPHVLIDSGTILNRFDESIYCLKVKALLNLGQYNFTILPPPIIEAEKDENFIARGIIYDTGAVYEVKVAMNNMGAAFMMIIGLETDRNTIMNNPFLIPECTNQEGIKEFVNTDPSLERYSELYSLHFDYLKLHSIGIRPVEPEAWHRDSRSQVAIYPTHIRNLISGL